MDDMHFVIVDVGQCKSHPYHGWHFVVHRLHPRQKQTGVAEVFNGFILWPIPLEAIADVMLPKPA